MKKIFYLCALSVATLASCTKDNSSVPVTTKHTIGEDNRCVSNITLVSNLLPGDDTCAQALFTENSLPAGNMVFLSVARYTQSVGGVMSQYIYVTAIPMVNYLPVLNMQTTYNFKDRIVMNMPAEDMAGVTTSLDTNPELKVSQARALFALDLHKHGMATLADSCMDAVFGYYNINKGKAGGPGLVKAWRVKPSMFDFPLAYYKEDGTLLLFDQGFVIL